MQERLFIAAFFYCISFEINNTHDDNFVSLHRFL